MVADSPPRTTAGPSVFDASTAAHAAPPHVGGHPPASAGRLGAMGKDAVTHLLRAAAIQWEILVLQIKLKLQQTAILAALAAGVLVLGVLAVIFTYIFVFHALLLVLAPVWVWLIFAGAHILAVVGMLILARVITHRMAKAE